MAKKVLSIVLAALMLMSVLVVGTYAADTNEMKVKKLVLGLGAGGSTTLSDTTYNSWLAMDDEILERNLSFWNDDIIAEYNACSTQAEWGALFNKMADPKNDDCWVPYEYEGETEYNVKAYPVGLKNDKAKVQAVISTDKEYVEKGDIITVTISMTTNFITRECYAGVFYDPSLVELVSGSITVPGTDDYNFGRKLQSANYNFGITNTGSQLQAYSWPAPLRNQEAYDKYAAFMAINTYDTNVSGFKYGKVFNNTPVITAEFEVLTDVDGTRIDFFAPEGSNPVNEDYGMQLDYGAVLFKTVRIISESINKTPYDCSEYDQDYTFTNGYSIVGQPAPDLADYTALDAAIADFDDSAAADYKADTWTAYANAVAAGNALSRDLTADEQATVDAAAKDITDAKAALEKNAVVSATETVIPTVGEKATIDVVVEGSPAKIGLSGDTTFTFDRADAEIVNNADGTETWTVTVAANKVSADYTVLAQYANWTDDGVALTVTAKAADELDLAVYSIVVPDMYLDDGEPGVILKGKHKVIVTTGLDVYKIQFVDTRGKIENGSTYTYACDGTGGAATCERQGDRLVWTFDHAFGPLGEWTMPVRTRATTTTFATVDGVALSALVVY